MYSPPFPPPQQNPTLTPSPHSSLLTTHLSTLSTTASTLPTQIPPEIVEYVEDGRNPDIYTREFVELVGRGNEALRGKCEAFAAFRDVLAEEVRRGVRGEEVRRGVERVVGGGEGK